jgi:hypothetical protein
MAHCWKGYYEYCVERGLDDGLHIEATCLLEDGHAGDHQFTDDANIQIVFASRGVSN